MKLFFRPRIADKMLGLFCAVIMPTLASLNAQENFFFKSVDIGTVSIPVVSPQDVGTMNGLVQAVDRELNLFASNHFNISSSWKVELSGRLKDKDLEVMRIIKSNNEYASPGIFEPGYEKSLPANADEHAYQAYASLERHLKTSKNTSAYTLAKSIRAQVYAEAMAVSGRLKMKYQRSRPLPRANPLDYAFPSQHATLGRMLGLYYYHFLGGEKKHTALIEDGIRIGLNRVLSENHHPTDILAGEFVANQVFCHKFKKQFYQDNFSSCLAGLRQLPSIFECIQNGGRKLPTSLSDYSLALNIMKPVMR